MAGSRTRLAFLRSFSRSIVIANVSHYSVLKVDVSTTVEQQNAAKYSCCGSLTGCTSDLACRVDGHAKGSRAKRKSRPAPLARSRALRSRQPSRARPRGTASRPGCRGLRMHILHVLLSARIQHHDQACIITTMTMSGFTSLPCHDNVPSCLGLVVSPTLRASDYLRLLPDRSTYNAARTCSSL